MLRSADDEMSTSMDHQVRADSAVMMNGSSLLIKLSVIVTRAYVLFFGLSSVMREVSAEPDFQENLDQTRDRVDAIESLHRTNELVIKDNEGIFKIAVGRG